MFDIIEPSDGPDHGRLLITGVKCNEVVRAKHSGNAIDGDIGRRKVICWNDVIESNAFKAPRCGRENIAAVDSNVLDAISHILDIKD
jgi:hypothetical protein